MSKRHSMTRALAALAVVGLAAATSACELEVQNPGAILEEDLNTPNMMEVLATGVSAELSDAVETNDYTIVRLLDETIGSGSYGSTADLRRGFLDDGDTGGEWGETHEAAWAAGEAIERMDDVLGSDHEIYSELVSRMYMIQSVAYNILGENFCQVAFDVGPAEPKSAAFERALTSAQNAIDVGTGDPDAEDFVTAAHGVRAQAYVGLEMWDAAAQAAANVPTDFELVAFFDPGDNQHAIWTETHNRPEFTAWHTLADMLSDDSDEVPNDVYNALIDTGEGQDPRAPFTICGIFDPDTEIVDDTGRCAGTFQGASGDATPHYRQERLPEWSSDVPVVSGVEMRLIEAEAALVNGDLQGFADGVNAVRDHYDELDNIAVPTSAGSLRNDDEMDAWSILDRERWLTLWLQGRRMWDMHRWDHPFLEGGVLTDKYPVEARRASCFPIPESECDRNPNISCS